MPETTQLSLFGPFEIAETEDSTINWSYSRRQTLDRCARQYYYSYYGSKASLATDDPQKEAIRLLSSFTNRYLRSGELLHLAIRLFYTKQNASDWLIDWAKRTYRADYEFSKSGDPLRSSQQDYPPQMLMEFYYKDPHAESAFFESEERLVNALETFLESPTLAEIRYNGRRPSSVVEEPVWVKTAMFNARGKVDLAYFTKNGLVIIDWKMGQVETSKSLQLAFYALWAVETKGYDVETITLYYGQLSDGTLREIIVNKQDLLRARARIIQDLELQRLLDPYGRGAKDEAFRPCSLPRVCKLCIYQGICPGAAV